MTDKIFEDPATILVFTYNRIEHTKKTIEALLRNEGTEHSSIVLYSDGPKNKSDENLVHNIREYLKTIAGFKNKLVINRPVNFGLAKSIIHGVQEAFSYTDKVIVLEDDMVTSPFFLRFMNEALAKYEDDPRVACIHGYVYPGLKKNPETFFLRGADCWGWGTWRKSWQSFNPNGKFLLNELRNKNLIKEFDFNGSYPFSKMLQNQVLGKNDSWAIRWYASIFLENKLTLYPSKSLVQNIGMDSSGQNCIETSDYDVNLSSKPIAIENISIAHSRGRFLEFENFFRSQHNGLFQRIAKRVRLFL